MTADQHANGSYRSDLAHQYARLFTDSERELYLYATWLRVCGNVRGHTVLDFGCGAGTSSRPLARRGASVIGFDPSLEQIRIARTLEADDPLHIVYMQSSQLPVIQRHGFDLVTAALSLNYARNRHELRSMLSQIFVNLKHGGRCVALINDPDDPIEPGPHFPRRVVLRWADVSQRYSDGTKLHIQLYTAEGEALPPFSNFYYSREAWTAEATTAGFTDIRFWRTCAPEQYNVTVLVLSK